MRILRIQYRRMAAVLLMVIGGCANPPRDPYVIQIDLGTDIRALSSDDIDESGPAADRLAALGPVALPALRSALQREDAPVRSGVVEVLQGLSGEESAELLIEAAGDRDPTVRTNAILSLGLRAEPSGRAAVETALADADPGVRRAAAAACHALCRSPAALNQLVELALADQERAVAQRALSAALNSTEGRDPARAAIAARALPLLSDEATDDERRFAAAQVAALIGQREALPVLLAALAPETRADRRATAALAVGGLDDPAAVAALAAAVGGTDAGTRNAACVALGQQRQRRVEGAATAAEACATPPK
jgi:HEAT repeat protein